MNYKFLFSSSGSLPGIYIHTYNLVLVRESQGAYLVPLCVSHHRGPHEHNTLPFFTINLSFSSSSSSSSPTPPPQLQSSTTILTWLQPPQPSQGVLNAPTSTQMARAAKLRHVRTSPTWRLAVAATWLLYVILLPISVEFEA